MCLYKKLIVWPNYIYAHTKKTDNSLVYVYVTLTFEPIAYRSLQAVLTNHLHVFSNFPSPLYTLQLPHLEPHSLSLYKFEGVLRMFYILYLKYIFCKFIRKDFLRFSLLPPYSAQRRYESPLSWHNIIIKFHLC